MPFHAETASQTSNTLILTRSVKAFHILEVKSKKH